MLRREGNGLKLQNGTRVRKRPNPLQFCYVLFPFRFPSLVYSFSFLDFHIFCMFAFCIYFSSCCIFVWISRINPEAKHVDVAFYESVLAPKT